MVLAPLGLGWQTVVSHGLGAGNQTWILQESSSHRAVSLAPAASFLKWKIYAFCKAPRASWKEF